MGNLNDIRAGLCTALGVIDTLRAHATIPDSIAPPAAIVGGPELVQFDHTFGRTSDRYTIAVRVYVGKASDRNAQEKLDAYIAGSGADSVKQALETDPTLNGACQSLRVTQVRGYGVYPIGGVEYLGAEFVIDVIG